GAIGSGSVSTSIGWEVIAGVPIGITDTGIAEVATRRSRDSIGLWSSAMVLAGGVAGGKSTAGLALGSATQGISGDPTIAGVGAAVANREIEATGGVVATLTAAFSTTVAGVFRVKRWM